MPAPDLGFGIGAVAALALASACAAPIADETPGARTRDAIVYGEESDASEDGVFTIIAKAEGGGTSSCTATLVAPNVVFTALHCVSHFAGGIFTCMADGTLVPNKPGNGAIGALAPASSVKLYAGTDITDTEPVAFASKLIGTGAPNICRNDFAIVILDRELDYPVSMIRMDRPLKRGETMTVVGYGLTEDQTSRGRRRRTGLKVLDVGPLSAAEVGTTPVRTFVTGQGPCLGDSGGPAFVEDTGALTGVYSLSGSTLCTANTIRNTYTRISPFRKMIEDAFAEASAEPILEPYDGPPEGYEEPEPEPEPTDDRFSGSGSRSSGCTFALAPGATPFASLALVALTFGLTRRRVRRNAR